MPPMEYKVLKMPHNRQEFYSYFLRSFGWQVQGMQENVDRVETSSFGTTLSTGTGHQNATFWHHPYTNNTTMSGRTYNHGWSTQMGNQVTDVKTSLSVTYVRDLAIPNHDRLAQLEAQCWPFVNQYFGKLDSGLADNTNWREWQSFAYLSKKAQNLMQAGTESLVQATGEFFKLEASHNPEVTSIRLSFSLQGRKDMNCLAIVYFKNADGNSLRDSDSCYDDRKGNVAVTCYIKPRFGDSRWDDLKVAIPWDQLHIQKRKETVRYYAALIDLSTDSEIVRTSSREFSYSRSLFGKVEVEEIPAGPLETTGHLPQPAKPAPEHARPPVPVTAPVRVAPPAPAKAAPVSKAPAVAKTPKRASAPAPAGAVPDASDLPPASGEIRRVRLVHNVVTDGRLGMQIQTDFRIRRRKGIRCRYVVRLLDHFGNPLKDVNRQYSNETGDVCVSCAFTPDSDDAHIKDLTVFIPYEELDLPDGEYDLRLASSLYDEAKQVSIVAQDRVFFYYVQDGDTAQGYEPRSFTELIRAAKQQAATENPSKDPASPAVESKTKSTTKTRTKSKK